MSLYDLLLFLQCAERPSDIAAFTGMTLAAIRPDSWNLPLFLHVLAGMVLVGVLVTGAVALLTSGRHEQSAMLRRLAFRSLLFGGVPTYIAMFASGEWISSKEGLGGEDDPAWFIIGILVSDLVGLLLAVSIVLAMIASWKSKVRVGRVAGAVAALALILCLVGVWAMTTKPS